MVLPRRFFPHLFLTLLCGCAALLARGAGDVRFSATMAPDVRERAGLNHLSEDNVAIIDGLVRQDDAASKFKDNDVDHTRFSQRRTAREREISGLDRLSPAQVAVLDDLVSQRISGIAPVASGFVATPARPAAATTAKPLVSTPTLDIHGEIGFTYGWGKGGSFSGGDIVLTHDDPAGRYSVLVAYSQYQGKGLYPAFGFFPGYGPYAGAMPFSR